MPDFLGIGSQKAGTTWLYTHLGSHPELDFPATRSSTGQPSKKSGARGPR